MLMLINGLIDIGFLWFIVDGEWVNNLGNECILLKGKLCGQKIDVVVEFFGVMMFICQLLFNVDYDLYWCKVLWQLDEVMLNGIIYI